MDDRFAWSRRAALSALAGLSAPGVATCEDPSPPGDNGAFLETAFDQAVRLTVPVYLNGQGPFPFVIDTGANRSVVAEDVALQCRLPADGLEQVHGIVSAEQAPMVKVRRLRVGNVLSSNLRLPTVAHARLGAAGILGLDTMRGRVVKLGFRNRSFDIQPSGGGAIVAEARNSRMRQPGDPVVVPARYRSGQLVILDAEAAGRPITAFIDSGSQVTVANGELRKLVVAARPELARDAHRSELISATGQRINADFFPLADLRIGGLRLQSPLVAYADLHIFDLWDLHERPTVLIGVDVLRRFNAVAFDFAKRNVTFWPPNRLKDLGAPPAPGL